MRRICLKLLLAQLVLWNQCTGLGLRWPSHDPSFPSFCWCTLSSTDRFTLWSSISSSRKYHWLDVQETRYKVHLCCSPSGYWDRKFRHLQFQSLLRLIPFNVEVWFFSTRKVYQASWRRDIQAGRVLVKIHPGARQTWGVLLLSTHSICLCKDPRKILT